MLKLPFFLVILFASFFCSGCLNSQKFDYKFIEIPKVINTDPEKTLSKEELKYDLEQLRYALMAVYSGSKFLPSNEFTTLIVKLSKIYGPSTAKALCVVVDNYFEEVSDSHLNAKFNDENCAPNNNRRVPSVGKNFYEEDKLPWSVKYETKGKNKALLISITSFHKRSSPVWVGFLEKVKKMVPSSDLVIIDMRGNGGGDDEIGYELSALLAGSNLKTPYAEQWNNEKPESFQIFINTLEYRARMLKNKGQEVPRYIIDLKNVYVDKRKRASRGEKVPFGDVQGSDNSLRKDFNYDLSIKKPIYILIDSDCGSSCESTTDYFELNTLVKTVGENTAGFVHFGNNGNVFLKNSGIRVQMAASYNSYKDGRFIEKKGITPKIKTFPGEDAMQSAWKDYLKSTK